MQSEKKGGSSDAMMMARDRSPLLSIELELEMQQTKAPATSKLNRIGVSSAIGAFAVAALLGATVLIASPGTANAARWCASYDDGSTNCGFKTLRQCRKDVQGVGGTCQRNRQR